MLGGGGEGLEGLGGDVAVSLQGGGGEVCVCVCVRVCVYVCVRRREG